jgi:hypothetical protein
VNWLAAAAPQAGISSGTIVALCAVLTIVGGFVLWSLRRAWSLARRTIQFLDDWNGEPAREGVKPRPGVMARLGSVEDMVSGVAEQMTLNGGSSMHDVVVSTAGDVKTVKAELAVLSARVELFEHQREQRDNNG